MAQRYFWFIEDVIVKKGIVDFKWEPGLSTAQKRRSCANMIKVINEAASYGEALDISSASTEDLGVKLSAFNLKWKGRTIECWYQGSKVYKNAGVVHHLYDADPVTAKQYRRKLAGDIIVGFNLAGQEFPTEPRTFFYDYIYLNGLYEQFGTGLDISKYNAFTDIQSNLEIEACQARSVCEYKLLQQNGQLEFIKDPTMLQMWHEIFVKE